MSFEKKLNEALGLLDESNRYFKLIDKSTKSVWSVLAGPSPILLSAYIKSLGKSNSDFIIDEISKAEYEQLKAGGATDVSEEEKARTARIASRKVRQTKPKTSLIAANTPKVVEIIFGRGVGIWLDGKEPDGEFDFKGNEKWETLDLSFGGVPISGIEFDVNPNDMWYDTITKASKDDEGESYGSVTSLNSNKSGTPPTTIILKIGDIVIHGKAIRTITAPDDKMVRLINGKIVNISNQVYVRFSLR